MSMTRNLVVGSAAAVVITALSVVMPAQDSAPGSVVRHTPTVSPFPTSGTVPVVTPGPEIGTATSRPESSVRSSGEINKSAERETRESSANAPYGDAESVREEARIIAENAQRLQTRDTSTLTVTSTRKKKVPVSTIKGYSFCGWKVSQAQRCIDQGKLTLYKPSGVKTLAGHNYMGWYWIDDLPKGRKVVIKSGSLKGTYKVYGHAKVYDKKFPKSGLGADVALQTCEGSGIGFSFLRRV